MPPCHAGRHPQEAYMVLHCVLLAVLAYPVAEEPLLVLCVIQGLSHRLRCRSLAWSAVMNCNIETGYDLQQGAVTDTSTCIEESPGRGILFSPKTPVGTIYSAPIWLDNGRAMLVEAYNMPADKHIFVNRVVLSASCPTDRSVGCNCDPLMMQQAYGSPGVITFRARMKLGNSFDWKLTAEKPQLLIAVPGCYYEFELEDPDMLGDLEVEYKFIDATKLPNLPACYYAGVSA